MLNHSKVQPLDLSLWTHQFSIIQLAEPPPLLSIKYVLSMYYMVDFMLDKIQRWLIVLPTLKEFKSLEDRQTHKLY